MTGKSTTGVDDQFEPETPMDADTLRRISGSWTSLAQSAREAGDFAVAEHHSQKASEYVAKALQLDAAENAKAGREAFVKTLFGIIGQ